MAVRASAVGRWSGEHNAASRSKSPGNTLPRAGRSWYHGRLIPTDATELDAEHQERFDPRGIIRHTKQDTRSVYPRTGLH